MGVEIECVVKPGAKLGESPFWDERDARLWWVDIAAGLIHRFDPGSGVNETFEFGEKVGSIARSASGLIVAAKSGFWHFDPEGGARRHLCDPEAHLPGNRFNDGATDMQGRFWAGTMEDGGGASPQGRFYQLDEDGGVTSWGAPVFTSNGLAFSPDGGRMYFSDSHPDVRMIWQADYDTTTGKPRNPRPFFDTRAVAGRPDGGTVDAEGCYWQAGVSGWQIYRITPRGQLDRTIDLPVEKPTKPMFGGPGLDTLFVTSISDGLDDPAAQPLAGGLLAIAGLGVRGVSQARYAGQPDSSG